MPPGNYVLIEVIDTGNGIPPENRRPHLRAVLLDQGGRLRHRPRPVDGLRHRQADRRLHLRRQSKPGRAPPSASTCRAMCRRGERRAGHRRDHGRSGADRATSPASAPCCWSRTRTPCACSAPARCATRATTCWKPAAARRRWRSSTAAANKQPIDLLITDVVMPRMDGPTLIKEVRRSSPTMKVIFISGYAEDAFRKRLDEDADIHFLPKPFTPEAARRQGEGSPARRQRLDRIAAAARTAAALLHPNRRRLNLNTPLTPLRLRVILNCRIGGRDGSSLRTGEGHGSRRAASLARTGPAPGHRSGPGGADRDLDAAALPRRWRAAGRAGGNLSPGLRPRRCRGRRWRRPGW